MKPQPTASRRAFGPLRRIAQALPLSLIAGLAACSSAPSTEAAASTASASTNESTFATNVTQFKAVSGTLAYWTDTSGNLWSGDGTSAPTFIDSDVANFATDDGYEVYVLDRTATLWRELGTAASFKSQVDQNVAEFQPFEFSYVYVKGTDNRLWLENGTYQVRQYIDANVASFQATDLNDVYVLGSNQNLWHEVGPWNDGTQGYTTRGNAPLDSSVSRFKVMTGATFPAIYVLDDSKVLWNETEDGSHSPGSYRYKVDGNVLRFSPVDAHTVYVQGTDTNLWQEASDQTSRVFTDAGGISEFQAITDQVVFVLWNGDLLHENMPEAPVSYVMPSGGLLNSSSGIWIYPNGNYTFTSYVQTADYWPVTDDFSVVWALHGSDGEVYTFAHSGSLAGCTTSCPSDSFGKTAPDAALKAGFAALKQGSAARWDVEKTTDWGSLLQNLEKAFKTIEKIVSVFAD